MYDAGFLTLRGAITDINVDFGGVFGFHKVAAGTGGTFMPDPNTIEYDDGGSLGMTGEFSGIGLNEFILQFSNSTSSEPLNYAKLDFNSFQNESLTFGLGGRQGDGQLRVVGDFKVIAAAGPSDLALTLGALLPIGLALYRTRRLPQQTGLERPLAARLHGGCWGAAECGQVFDGPIVTIE